MLPSPSFGKSNNNANSNSRYGGFPSTRQQQENSTSCSHLPTNIFGITNDPRRPASAPSTSTTIQHRDVGALLDLGLALGHERFEVVSLAARDHAGMVAAHAWADISRAADRPSSKRELGSAMQEHADPQQRRGTRGWDSMANGLGREVGATGRRWCGERVWLDSFCRMVVVRVSVGQKGVTQDG